MLRRASIGRLIGLIFALAICSFLLPTRAAMTDSLVAVTTLGGLGANDSVSWSQLGPDATMLLSGINASSAGAIALTGTLSNFGSLTAVVCPASPCSWASPGSGGFDAGDTLIWTSDVSNGGNGPLTLAFKRSVQGAGALIQADGPGQFTAQIQAFDGNASLGKFTATSDTNGDALFLGVLDRTAVHITSVIFSLTACTGACSDFALDTLSIRSRAGGPTATVTATATLPTLTPTATQTPGPTGTPTTVMVGLPARINFGKVDAAGASKPHKERIKNRGNIAAMVGKVGATTGFTIVPGVDLCSNRTVPRQGSCTLMVEFSPIAPRAFVGSLSVPYNGAVPLTVDLSGDGTAAMAKGPSSVVFGPLVAGSTGNVRSIVVSNLSRTAVLHLGTAQISGPFINASDMCTDASIKPHGKCTIGLQFSPPSGSTSKSTIPGTLNFDFTYGSNNGTVPTIALKGKVR